MPIEPSAGKFGFLRTHIVTDRFTTKRSVAMIVEAAAPTRQPEKYLWRVVVARVVEVIDRCLSFGGSDVYEVGTLLRIVSKS